MESKCHAVSVVLIAAVVCLSACRSTQTNDEQTNDKQTNDNWELDLSAITSHRGTGGLDNGTYPDTRFIGGYLPEVNSRVGFYFMGPGKILPQAALRVDRKEQVVPVRSEKRGSWQYEYWSGPDGCSAVGWVIRDDAGLHVTVKVTDDIHVVASDTHFMNDSLELYFDTRPIEQCGRESHDRGVFQITLVPDKSGTPIITLDKAKAVPGMTATCKMTKAGYDMKVFLPFEGLKVNHYVPGHWFNFDIGINDSDTPGERDTQMMWAGYFGNFMDARMFGRMRSVQRGYYMTSEADPPDEALLRIDSVYHVRHSARLWTGPADCSAVGWVRRGDDGITVRVDVTDDKIHVAHKLPRQNDSVELHFDMRPDKTRGPGEYEKGVFQLIVIPNTKGDQATVHFGRDKNEVPGVKATSQITDNGYRIEAFIPFDGMRVNHMVPGERFNFDYSINDSDSPKGQKTRAFCAESDDNDYSAGEV